MKRHANLYRILSLFFLTWAVALTSLAQVPVRTIHEETSPQEQNDEVPSETVATFQTQATLQVPALLPVPDLSVVHSIALPEISKAVPIDQVSKEQLSYFVNLFLSSICVHAP